MNAARKGQCLLYCPQGTLLCIHYITNICVCQEKNSYKLFLFIYKHFLDFLINFILCFTDLHLSGEIVFFYILLDKIG